MNAFQGGRADYGRTMIALLALAVAGQAALQPTPFPSPQAQVAPPSDPAAPYVIHGQDEPGYRSWYLADPSREAQVKAFNAYLVSAEVGGVLPTWQLLRTASSWQDCGGQPFEVPPPAEWPHIIQTLRYVRDYVVPAIGPVEAVSVYRNPVLNKCAGGAPESAHKLELGDRHGAASSDHPRGADADALRDPFRARRSIQCGARILCVPALPRRQHQVPALEHGPGGRRRLPADPPPWGCRLVRPAAASAAGAGDHSSCDRPGSSHDPARDWSEASTAIKFTLCCRSATPYAG